MSMKETEGVKIIGLGACPVVIRIRIALKIKGVPYEFVEEGVRTQGAGLSSSLKSDVVFLHRGRKISEPYKIVQYIDATWKAIDTPSILPSDKYDSIVETFWVKFIDDKFALAMEEILSGSMDVEEFDKTMQILECAFERCSQGKKFFGGEYMNYIDISLGSMLGFIMAAENKLMDLKLLDVEKTPLLFRWAEHFRAVDLIRGIIIADIDNIAEMKENEIYLDAMKLVYCPVLPKLLKFAIELGILDVIVNAASRNFLSTKEIADELNICNPDAPVLLDRILRCLASHGIFTYKMQKSDDGTTINTLYGAAPVCYYFVKDEHGYSLASLFLSQQNIYMMESWNYLEDTIMNGGTPFNKAYGMSLFEYASKDLMFNKNFNDIMSSNSNITFRKILNSYTGFDCLKTLVDVGGNAGITLKSIISKYPTIKGINFDLPHVIASAPIIQGVKHIDGNMFESVPSGDAILLKCILHDWRDEQCVKLLKKCWESLGAKGKVIVIETIVPIAPDVSHPSFDSDLNMLLASVDGKERTEMEFSLLAKKAGFSCLKIPLTIGNICVLEFIK